MKLIVFISIILIVVSCSKDKIRSGIVIDKRVEPAHTYVTLVPASTGKTTILIPIVIHDDEDYVIVVNGFNGKDSLQQELYLDKKDWACLSIGDQFNDSIPCSLEDINNRKERK